MNVRLSNSVVACVLYLGKMVWPADLAPIYPLRHDWSGWQVAGSALLLLSISLWAAFSVRKRPYLLVGWGWYLVTLFPTLGLVQVGSQGMADRYTYLPFIGISLFLVWEVSERARGQPFAKPVLGLGAGGAVGACAVATLVAVHYWRDSISLFEHAVRVTSNNYIACLQLGMACEDGGDLARAERLYRESLRIEPKQVAAELALGDALRWQRDWQGALDHYSSAMRIKPSDANPHVKIGELYLTSSSDGFRDAGKALEHARLACNLTHYRRRDALALLAFASAENHLLKQASDAAKMTLALSIGPKEVHDAMELSEQVSRLAAANHQVTSINGAQTQ